VNSQQGMQAGRQRPRPHANPTDLAVLGLALVTSALGELVVSDMLSPPCCAGGWALPDIARLFLMGLKSIAARAAPRRDGRVNAQLPRRRRCCEGGGAGAEDHTRCARAPLASPLWLLGAQQGQRVEEGG
jgi:hypothetical protein